MSFTTFNFWLLFPFVFALYWAIPAKWCTLRRVFLVILSYLLYMNWKPAFALVLLGVTLVTYWGGHFLQLRVEIEGLKVSEKKRRKRLAWCFALLALLPLLVFKYYNFLNDSISEGLSSIGLQFALPGLNWAIPVGISFFTFQAVGYMLDVYHGRVKAEKNLLDYILFVSFFPQVISGPISKADELLPQIKNCRKFDYELAKQGLKYIVWGIFMKLVIADRAGLWVDSIYLNYVHYSGSTLLFASILYTIQIYCDFAGYSLMAIGVAGILGFKLVNNFKRPYLATSVTDFWKRWHISLTRWLTQQVYIPLGGSRCSKLRNYLNILVTFFVSGIWHGANWTFILWGCLHGFFQIIEKALGFQKFNGRNRWLRLVRTTITLLLINFAWILFRMPDIRSFVGVFKRMISSFGSPDFGDMSGTYWALWLFAIVLLFAKEIKEEFEFKLSKIFDNRISHWLLYLFIFCYTILAGVTEGGDFIYANF